MGRTSDWAASAPRRTMLHQVRCQWETDGVHWQQGSYRPTFRVLEWYDNKYCYDSNFRLRLDTMHNGYVLKMRLKKREEN